MDSNTQAASSRFDLRREEMFKMKTEHSYHFEYRAWTAEVLSPLHLRGISFAYHFVTEIFVF